MVALASRYPIISCMAVSALTNNDHLNIPNFSRKPICARIEVPKLGKMTVYVCHLKSQRPSETDDRAIGRALVIRNPAWLGSDYVKSLYAGRICQCPTPTILVGDMNQNLSSDILASLTNQRTYRSTSKTVGHCLIHETAECQHITILPKVMCSIICWSLRNLTQTGPARCSKLLIILCLISTSSIRTHGKIGMQVTTLLWQ